MSITKIESNNRMTDYEAMSRFSNFYIFMHMDALDSDIGTVLYVSNSQDALFDLWEHDEDLRLRKHCTIFEGNNLRRGLGGVVSRGNS